MRIQVASQTMQVTQALRAFAYQQAEKLGRLNQRILGIRIVLNRRSSSKLDENALVKYVVQLPGKTVVIKRVAHDMYQALVEATDRAGRQLRKIKERRIDRTRHISSLEMASAM